MGTRLRAPQWDGGKHRRFSSTWYKLRHCGIEEKSPDVIELPEDMKTPFSNISMAGRIGVPLNIWHPAPPNNITLTSAEHA